MTFAESAHVRNYVTTNGVCTINFTPDRAVAQKIKVCKTSKKECANSAKYPPTAHKTRFSCLLSLAHFASENISKLERTKTFAKMGVQQMREDDYLGIVTFGTTAKVASPLIKMTDENKVRMSLTFRHVTLLNI